MFSSSFIIVSIYFILNSQLLQWCNAKKLGERHLCIYTYINRNSWCGVHIICIIPKHLKYDLLLYLVLYSILIVHAILIQSLWCKWKHQTSFYMAIPSCKRWWIVWVNSDKINKICVFAWVAFKRTANDVVSRKRKQTLNMQEGT